MDTPPIFPLLFQLSPLWLCFGCGCLFFQRLAARNFIGKDWRISWAFSVLLMGFLYVVIAESAGAMRRLTGGTVLALWLIADAALLAAVLRMGKPAWGSIIAGAREGWKRLSTLAAAKPSPWLWNAGLLVLVSAMILLIGVLSLLCPTNVWDSMTYHMPRAMHWMQQQSLSPYPTNIPRQLESAPGAELETTALMLLSGGDWPVNLPQWFALLTCGLLAGFLAERFLIWHFGKERLDVQKARWCGLFATLITVTIPAGVTQALSTQNDFLSAQWVTLLAVFGLLLIQEPKNYFYAAGVGAAFALGVANKPTMFIYAAPFGPVIALWLLRKSGRTLAALGVATAVFGLAANGPWMARNYEVFHHPLASQVTRGDQSLRDYAPAKMAANLFRNMALYADTPFTWSTAALNQVLHFLFAVAGEPPQDEGSVWHGQTFVFPHSSQVKNGDGLGGIMAALPLLLAAPFFLIRFKWKSPLLIYLCLVLAGFAVFSGYLRWQPWHQRLHLPLFVLAAPFAGTVLGWVWNRWLVLAASLLLVLNALLVLCYQQNFPIARLSSQPLITREARYFLSRPDLYPCTAEVAGDIVRSGVTNVDLKLGVDTWEYPLWVCLKNRGFHGTIQHVFVDNESGRLGAPNLDLQGAAILSEDASFQPPADFGLTVGYDSWTAHYRGKPENRTKLISNRLLAGVTSQQSARLQILCNPIDQNGQPITNNVLRLQTAGFTRDFPITSEQVLLECPLKPGQNPMAIVCLNPLSTNQRIMTLANMETRIAPDVQLSPRSGPLP